MSSDTDEWIDPSELSLSTSNFSNNNNDNNSSIAALLADADRAMAELLEVVPDSLVTSLSDRPKAKKAKKATSGGPFAKRPREMLVWILEFFTIYEVAGLQRLVCHEFRDAGQERIRERGGRKLFEQGMAYFYGLDHKTIDQDRGRLLIQASRDAGCKTALVRQRMRAPNLSDEDEPKILQDLKVIATSSPYHYVDYYIGNIIGEEKKNEAAAWLEKAAHKGNTQAMYALGNFYHNGDLGLTQSATKSIELLIFRIEVLNCKTKKWHFWNFQKEMNKCQRVVNTKIFFSMKFIFRFLIKNF